MNIERGNVWNQFLVSSVLVSLYAVTKVLSQIWGPSFARATPGREYGGAFLRLWVRGAVMVWIVTLLGDPEAFRASINLLSQNERLLPGSKNAWVFTSRSPQLTITGTTCKYTFEQPTLPGCRSFRIVERIA